MNTVIECTCSGHVQRNDFDVALKQDGAASYQKESGRVKLEKFFSTYGGTVLISNDQYRECPMCGSSCSSLFGIKYGIPIIDCVCGFRYAGKIAPETVNMESEFSRHLNTEHVEFINSQAYTHFTTLRSQYELQLIEKELQIYSSLQRRESVAPKILDIGCGTGIFLDIAALRGWEAHGVEPNLCAWEISAQKHQRVSNRWFSPEELVDHFDAITALDVLEHIPDPLPFLRAVREVLKDDGLFLVQVPNAWSLACQLRGLTDNIYNGLIHFSYFSQQSLEAICKKAGFAVVAKDSILSELSTVMTFPRLMREIYVQGLDALTSEAAADAIHTSMLGYKIVLLCKKEI